MFFRGMRKSFCVRTQQAPIVLFCVKSEKKFKIICMETLFFVKFAAIKPTYAKLGRVRGQPNAIKPHYKKLKN